MQLLFTPRSPRRAAFSLLSGVLSLTATLCSPATSNAQKVDDQKIWTSYHKAPILALAPKYKSYSVEYALGPTAMAVEQQPDLPNLEKKNAGGDLALRIFVPTPVITEQSVGEGSMTTNGSTSKTFDYTVSYASAYGYELLDAQTKASLASYKQTSGRNVSKSFKSMKELDAYMKAEYVPELTKRLLAQVTQRVNFELRDQTWQVRLGMNGVEGSAPAYQEISKAAADFTALAATATPDVEKIRPLVAVWEKHLANVKWDDKKAEINKKVGLALIENLCSAHLLLENYAAIKEKNTLHENQVSGLFARLPFGFEVEAETYSGPGTGVHMVMKEGKVKQLAYVSYKDEIGGRPAPAK